MATRPPSKAISNVNPIFLIFISIFIIKVLKCTNVSITTNLPRKDSIYKPETFRLCKKLLKQRHKAVSWVIGIPSILLTLKFMGKIKFLKYQGCGNDFIVIDNRHRSANGLRQEQVRNLCDRKFGIGADGLMLLQKHPELDFEMI